MPFDEEPVQATGYRPPATGRERRVVAWCIDLALVTAFFAAQVYVGGRACQVVYWLDFVRDLSPLLGAAAALSAVSYSFVFVALGGRTPGMALAGLRVRTLYGDPPTPAESLVRALLSVPSAALGVFGFTLALFDARGQTLHDKLCRCVVRID
ncbi:MAG: RDD family protein [Myxococcales bacterium]|nr:RDD family protein [Myxococcales bacterium]